MPANNSEIEVVEDFNVLSGSDSANGSEDEEIHSKNSGDIKMFDKSSVLMKNKTVMSDLKRLESLPSRDHHSKFLNEFLTEVVNSMFSFTDRKSKVLNWVYPEELLKIMDLEVKQTPDTDEKLMQLTKDIIKYSVKTGNPFFMNQLFSSVDPFGFAGQVLTDALNPSVYTYEVSPVFILMEEIVLKEMRKIVGFPNGDGDGIFCPGGSMANGYAISCGRYKYLPDVKVSLK